MSFRVYWKVLMKLCLSELSCHSTGVSIHRLQKFLSGRLISWFTTSEYCYQFSRKTFLLDATVLHLQWHSCMFSGRTLSFSAIGTTRSHCLSSALANTILSLCFQTPFWLFKVILWCCQSHFLSPSQTSPVPIVVHASFFLFYYGLVLSSPFYCTFTQTFFNPLWTFLKFPSTEQNRMDSLLGLHNFFAAS